jgi:fructose-1,6-bisphosphatase/inositol monophosphatase family enzyme
VDKQQFLMSSLAKFLVMNVKTLDAVVHRFPVAEISTKSDGSPVTRLDEALSNEIERLMKVFSPTATFYSEEKFSSWDFPLIALDPLDGTLEYIKGRNEWAISIGFFQDENFDGDGWVYNPMTREIFTESTLIPFEKKISYRNDLLDGFIYIITKSLLNKGCP